MADPLLGEVLRRRDAEIQGNEADPQPPAEGEETREDPRGGRHGPISDVPIIGPAVDFVGRMGRQLNMTILGAGIGAYRAGFETKDFLFGEPEAGEKSEFRKARERQAQEVLDTGIVPGLAMGVSQFLTGFMGAGKLTAPFKAVKALRTGGKVARAGENIGRAAISGAVVFDPHEERLSNLLVEFPMFDNAVTRYLAADPDDSEIEGRTKAVLESIGMDLTMVAPFMAALKVMKFARAGKVGSKAEADLAKSLGETEPAPAASSPTLMHGESLGETTERLRATGADMRATGADLHREAPKVGAEGIEAPPRDVLQVATVDDALRTIEARAPRTQTFPPGEVETLLQGMDADASALLRHGSRQGAAEAGVSVGASPLPWQKLQTPEDLEAFIERAAKVTEKRIAFRRGGGRDGVMHDEHVKRLVDMRVRLWGDDPEEVYGNIIAQGRNAKGMVADRIAAEALAVKAMDEAYAVANGLRLGELGQWGNSRAEALTELVARVSVATELLAANRAMGTAAGRTLRSLREDASTRLSFEQVRKLKGLKPEKLAEMLEGTGGDLQAIKFALERPGMLARLTDGLAWMLVNNLLWGLTTHAVNATTTAYMMGSRPLERAVGAYGLKLLDKLGIAGGPGASVSGMQALREYRYMGAALTDSVAKAIRAFMEGDSIIAGAGTSESMDLVTAGAFRSAGKSPLRRIEPRRLLDVSDLTGIGLRVAYWSIGAPTRLLGTIDELTRQIRYRGMVMADASMEADKRGLKGDEYRQFIHRSLLDSFDENGRGTNKRAIQEAKVVNFQQDLLHGTLGRQLQGAVAQHPYLRFVFPYVRTPINVLRHGVKLTPGLNLLQENYRQAFRGELGAEEQAQAYGQMALGSAFLALVAYWETQGMVTGSGPSDHETRRNMRGTGWKPNSIVLPNDDGSFSSFQLGRFDPIGLPFGIVADIAHILRHGVEVGDGGLVDKGLAAVTGVVVAMASQVRERTYLQNIRQMVDFLGDPKNRGPRFLGRLASNTIVPLSSAFRNYGGEGMQYLRETRRFVDEIMATVPGFAEGVPLRYNALGEPIRINRSPFTSVSDDVVDQELIRMGMEGPEGFTIGRISPNTGKGVDLRDVTLEDGRNAYEVVQVYSRQPVEGAPTLRDALATAILSPEYQAAIDGLASTKGTKQWILGRITRRYREAANKRLRAESKILRDALMEAARKAQAALEGVRSEGTSGTAKAQRDMLRRLGESYGIPIGGPQ